MHLPFVTESIVDDVLGFFAGLTAPLNTLLSPIRLLHVSALVSLGFVQPPFTPSLAVPITRNTTQHNDHQVLILGGGVAGVMAAQTLHRRGITNFKIVEARDELGGRMKKFKFGAPGREYELELGADWIHGTQTGDGPANPIYDLARKHGLSTQPNSYRGSMTTYDFTGQIDYLDVFYKAVDHFAQLTVAGGDRVPRGLIDGTSRSGYSLIGAKPRTHQEAAAEYYQFDWEYAQAPEQSSWIASSWANNFTFNVDQGGFSAENLLSTDQRGFASILQAEASEFLTEEQVLLNSSVKTIKYSSDGVSVTLTDGSRLSADHALVTFSLGVLQNDDVRFEPTLPEWKAEAIHGMAMGIYTKIYIQFPEKFWFDTEFALYADRERGWYPVWQGLDIDGFFPGSGILFVTVTGDFAKRVESLSDEVVKSEVLAVMRSMYPNTTIPEPDAFYFPRWNSDPLYRGSYSNWPASLVREHHLNLRATVDKRLWFAGEATSLKYYGYLHGAFFEGQRVAADIAQCIQDDECPGLPHIAEVLSTSSYHLEFM
ncbi:amine oxidase [Auriscalpium vulgare]|uniref:Amine oxidase n=1 Tax=Auriscalpium vulgare TaxID=40419 RepID=A0ACB8RT77_9AGAM|nr:amine oxidase [Auriscalpium vulgare]